MGWYQRRVHGDRLFVHQTSGDELHLNIEKVDHKTSSVGI